MDLHLEFRHAWALHACNAHGTVVWISDNSLGIESAISLLYYEAKVQSCTLNPKPLINPKP